MITDTPLTADYFSNDIEMYLQLFCEENNIESMKTEPQMIWNSCLRYIYNHVFKPNKQLLKSKNMVDAPNGGSSNCNAYDYELVLQLADYYAYDLCMKYNKEVSILGFCALTGIDSETIHYWGNDNNKISRAGLNVYKKLCAMREESLSNKLADGKQNPVGVIAILNRQFGWASPYTSDSNRQRQTLTAADLPKLGASRAEVIQVIDINNGESAQ